MRWQAERDAALEKAADWIAKSALLPLRSASAVQKLPPKTRPASFLIPNFSFRVIRVFRGGII